MDDEKAAEILDIQCERAEPYVLDMLSRPRKEGKDGAVTYGAPYATKARGNNNAVRILMYDTRWNGTEAEPRIRLNEFTREVELDGKPITDGDEYDIHLWLSMLYGLHLEPRSINGAVEKVAREDAYHPVRDYFDGLEHDGGARVAGLLVDYLGALDTPLNRELGKRWAIACVARVYEPGCQCDATLTLQGKQGARKSSAFRVLAIRDEWFSDSAVDFRSRDSYLALQGTFILEFSEMDSLRRADQEAAKAWLTSRHDKYRPPYGRRMVTVPRSNVTVATTNSVEFLGDPTGSRRIWPVTVGHIDLDKLISDRDQLWAEARALYMAGERWHLDTTEEVALATYSQRFAHQDAWAEATAHWLAGSASFEFGVKEALNGIGVETERMTRGDAIRMAKILQQLGCEKTGERKRVNGVRCYPWRKPTTVINLDRSRSAEPAD